MTSKRSLFKESRSNRSLPVRIFRIAAPLITLMIFLGPYLPGPFAKIGILLARVQIGQVFVGAIARGAVILTITLAILLVLSVVLGRFYCSSICPMGFLQDLVIRPRKKEFIYKKPFILRYPIALAAYIAALAGSVTVFTYLDPFGIFSRFTSLVVHPFIPAIADGTGLHLASNNLLVITEIVGLLSVVIILIMAVWRGRLFCNTLCPVGALLGVLGKASPMKVHINESCTKCGQCEKVCKAECINADEMTVDNSRCIICFDCLSVCSFDAIKYSTASAAHDPSRRKSIINGTTAGLVTVAAIATTFPIPLIAKYDRRAVGHMGPPRNSIVPPGALSYAHLVKYCTGCSACAVSCPSQIITIKPSAFDKREAVIPQISFENGFCPPDCNICSNVCPSMALVPLSLEARKNVRYGSVFIDMNKCIIRTDGHECAACAQICPSAAIDMRADESGVVMPHLVPSLCTGCGACQYTCPVEPIKAVQTMGLPIHQSAQIPEDSRRIDNNMNDFPF